MTNEEWNLYIKKIKEAQKKFNDTLLIKMNLKIKELKEENQKLRNIFNSKGL